MKANELMIGDLFRVSKGVCFKKGTIVKVRGIDADNVFAEKGLKGSATCVAVNDPDRCTGGVWCDYLEPIPLTPEILEANGWEKVAQPGCANPFHWQMERYEDNRHDEAYLLYRIKAYETFFREMLVIIHHPSACEPISFRKQIEYVHHFQHALRDCDIDKEIIVKEE